MKVGAEGFEPPEFPMCSDLQSDAVPPSRQHSNIHFTVDS